MEQQSRRRREGGAKLLVSLLGAVALLICLTRPAAIGVSDAAGPGLLSPRPLRILGEVTLAPKALPAIDEIQFEGMVEALPGSTTAGKWKVDGTTVIVDADTTIQGEPKLGSDVEISGGSAGPNSIRADLITVAGESSQVVILQGALSTSAFASVETKVLLRDSKGIDMDEPVLVDEETFIDESQGPASSGSWVEIRAIRREDGSLWAQYIKVERE